MILRSEKRQVPVVPAGTHVTIEGLPAVVVARVADSHDGLDSLYQVRFKGQVLPAAMYYLGTQLKVT